MPFYTASITSKRRHPYLDSFHFLHYEWENCEHSEFLFRKYRDFFYRVFVNFKYYSELFHILKDFFGFLSNSRKLPSVPLNFFLIFSNFFLYFSGFLIFLCILWYCSVHFSNHITIKIPFSYPFIISENVIFSHSSAWNAFLSPLPLSRSSLPFSSLQCLHFARIHMQNKLSNLRQSAHHRNY